MANKQQSNPKENDVKTNEGKKSKDTLAAMDSCLTSATLHVAVGLLGGFLGSVLVRKRWPIIVGLGFGTGQSIGCCKDDFEDEEAKDKRKKRKEVDGKDANAEPKNDGKQDTAAKGGKNT